MFENFRKMTRNFSPEDFKKEWNDFEIRGVEDYLTEVLHDVHGKDYTDLTNRNNKLNAGDFFGLTYTSTSQYAMLGVTANYQKKNKLGIPDNLRISHFVLTNSEYPQLIAVCWDTKENEYFYDVQTTPASEF